MLPFTELPLADINIPMDFETKNKYGVKKVLLMLHFIPVLEAKGSRKLRNSFDKLKSFICQQIKRGITPQEEINLCQGICNYVKSDAETNPRIESMDYLFEMKFLND